MVQKRALGRGPLQTVGPLLRRRLRGVYKTALITRCPVGRALVRELVRYLLENAYIDFRGDIAMDKVRQFLREDDSRESRLLLAKLIEDKGVDELLLALADVLKEYIQVGVTEEVVREQLMTYSES